MRVGLRVRPVLILGGVGYVCTEWGMVVYGWVVGTIGMRWTVDFTDKPRPRTMSEKKIISI